MIESFVLGGLLISLVMTGLWLYQLRSQNASHVDVGWAYGIGLVAAFIFWREGFSSPGSYLVLFCTLFWSLRLGTFLFFRLHGRPEDSRYADLRREWNQTKFYIFYLFQGLAVVLFAIPSVLSMQATQDRSPGIQEILALLVAFGSIAGEWTADRQLLRFKQQPENRGRTCNVGLWRYSRHPNYFFEWLFWFTFPVFAWGSPSWYWTLLGPLVMIALLFGMTGIPPSEARALKSRGDDYRQYQQKTSVFFPWFPKK